MKTTFLSFLLASFVVNILNASDEEFVTKALEYRTSHEELKLTKETNQGFNGITAILSPRENEAFAVVHSVRSIEPELYQLTERLGLSRVVPRSVRTDTEVFQEFVVAMPITIDLSSVPDDYKRLVEASKNPLTGGMTLSSISRTRQSFDPLIPLIDRLSVQKNFLLWVLTLCSDMTPRNCMLTMSESGKVLIQAIDNDGINTSVGAWHTYALGLPGCQDPIAPELKELVNHWDRGLIQENEVLIKKLLINTKLNDDQKNKTFSSVINRIKSLNEFWSSYPNASIRSTFLFAFWETPTVNEDFSSILGFDLLSALNSGGFRYYGIEIPSEWPPILIDILRQFMKTFVAVVSEDLKQSEEYDSSDEEYSIDGNLYHIAKKNGPLFYLARLVSWLKGEQPYQRFDQQIQKLKIFRSSDTALLRENAIQIIQLIGAK